MVYLTNYSYEEAALCSIANIALPPPKENLLHRLDIYVPMAGYVVRILNNWDSNPGETDFHHAFSATFIDLGQFYTNVMEFTGLTHLAHRIHDLAISVPTLISLTHDRFRANSPTLYFLTLLPLIKIVNLSTSSLVATAVSSLSYLYFLAFGQSIREIVFDSYCAKYVDSPYEQKSAKLQNLFAQKKLVSFRFLEPFDPEDEITSSFDIQALHQQLNPNDILLKNEVPAALIRFLEDEFPMGMQELYKIDMGNSEHRLQLFQSLIARKRELIDQKFIGPLIEKIMSNRDSYNELEAEVKDKLDLGLVQLLENKNAEFIPSKEAEYIVKLIHDLENKKNVCLDENKNEGILSFFKTINNLSEEQNCESKFLSKLKELKEELTPKFIEQLLEQEVRKLFSYSALNHLFDPSSESKRLPEHFLIEFLSFVSLQDFDSQKILFNDLTFAEEFLDLSQLKEFYEIPEKNPFLDPALLPILRISDTRGAKPFDLSKPLAYSRENVKKIERFLGDLYAHYAGTSSHTLLTLWLMGLKVRG